MLKCVDSTVTFAEIPDEITLVLNISNCPCHCKGCHSPYLAEDIGLEIGWHAVKKNKSLDLHKLIKHNEGISCVCFMGGDNDPRSINRLAATIKSYQQTDRHFEYLKNIRVAWYSGRQELSPAIDLKNFDYIKLGPYIQELGPLNLETTNQRMYKILYKVNQDGTTLYKMEDITSRFWKRRDFIDNK